MGHFQRSRQTSPCSYPHAQPAIPFLTALTIAPITSTIRSIPTEVVVTRADGLFTDCAANLDNIQTVHKAKIGGFIGHLSVQRMRGVRKAVEFALGFDVLR